MKSSIESFFVFTLHCSQKPPLPPPRFVIYSTFAVPIYFIKLFISTVLSITELLFETVQCKVLYILRTAYGVVQYVNQ